MLNLYLDDTRMGPFNDPTGYNEGWERWVIVRSVENAKQLLALGLVQDLSLDNDMGMNSEEGGYNPEGMELVKWMVDTGLWPKGVITIHSANYIRADQMRSLINQARPKE